MNSQKTVLCFVSSNFHPPFSAMEDFNDRSEGTNEFKEDSGAEDAAVGKDGSSTSLVLKQFCSTRCEIRLTYCPTLTAGGCSLARVML